jgi:transposase
MTHSIDFRRHVLKVKEEEGLSFEETSKRFKLGKTSLFRWSKKLEPTTKRNKPWTKLSIDKLQQDIETYPDAYQYERASRLGVSQSGIRSALKRLGISYVTLPPLRWDFS